MVHPTTPTTVLLVEPQEVSRKGIRALLEETGEFVVNECSELSADADGVAELSCDLLIFGLSSDDRDAWDAGLATIDAVAADTPDARIVAIIADSSLDAFVAVARAGVKGVATKEGPSGSLVDCVRAVAEGRCAVGPKVACTLLDHFGAHDGTPPGNGAHRDDPLTAREREVLGELTRGLRNDEIGRHLGLSSGTVKTHVRQIYRKLGVRDRSAAILLAVAGNR